MNAIVYRNTGMIVVLAFLFPSKQKSLFHWLFVPFCTFLPPSFGCPLLKNVVFKAVNGGDYE
jgi:hypothetical protein